MKKIIRQAAGTLTLGMSLILPGCVTHEATVYQDTERTKIEFENDAAGRIFYETLSQRKGASSHGEIKTEVHIPVVFTHKRRVVGGPDNAFNEAVSECDTNRDGKITESEARIFAGRRRK